MDHIPPAAVSSVANQITDAGDVEAAVRKFLSKETFPIGMIGRGTPTPFSYSREKCASGYFYIGSETKGFFLRFSKMENDKYITEAAATLIRAFGCGAAAECARVADRWDRRGDAAAAALWRRIQTCVVVRESSDDNRSSMSANCT